MTLLEDTFLHPATLFVVLGLILPFLRGNFWRALLFIPPAAAIVLTLHAHPGIYWEVDYVGQSLVLGRVDMLSLPFIILFAFMSLICTLFSFHVRDKAQHVAALFFMAGAFGSVLAGDYWTLYMFWQGMTVSSSFLIWLNRDTDASKTGFVYMMLLLLSSVLLLAGILLRERATGTFIFGPADSNLMWHYDWLVLGAFAINAAVIPLHAWMTQGLLKATLPGAVLLSIFGIKTALYTMTRCFAGLDLLIVLGALMALYGGVYAVFSNNMRRIIAYLMVAQGGLMVTGIGMESNAALDGAISLAYAHTFYNALLLMALGGIIYATRREHLAASGTFARKFPVVAASTFLGMLGLFAVPFFGGFPGISLIFEEALKLQGPLKGPFVAVLLALSMMLMILAGTRLLFFLYRSEHSGHSEPLRPIPGNMVVAVGVAGAFCLVHGLLPQGVDRLLPYPLEKGVFNGKNLLLGFLFPAACVLFFMALRPWLKPRPRELHDVEVLYALVGRGVMAVLSKPLSWMDRFWSEIYRTVFLRAFGFVARFFDTFDRKGIDGAVNRTAFSVMFLSRISTRLQSSRLQDQLGRMMLLALAIFALIWFW
jgi:multicomponent Na+:H+ antiporter subunit D